MPLRKWKDLKILLRLLDKIFVKQSMKIYELKKRIRELEK